MTSQIEDILSNMRFGPLRNSVNGMGRNVPLTCHSKEFHLTTPLCIAPFGISRRSGSVSLALRPLQPDSNHLKFLSTLDETIVAYAHANQDILFGINNKSVEVIEDKYYPCVKNKSADHKPFFESKLKYNKHGMPTYSLTDADGNIIENVEKGSTITAVVAYPSLWVSSTGFGLNAKLVKAEVQPPVNTRIASYAIIDEM